MQKFFFRYAIRTLKPVINSMEHTKTTRWDAHNRRVTAIHESAHAVVALACGSRVYDMSIEASAGPRGPRLGYCAWSTAYDEDRELTIILAGGVAERLWWPRRSWNNIMYSCYSDYCSVGEIITRLFADMREQSRFVRVQTRRARAILREYRQAVDLLATALDSKGFMGEDDICGVVDPFFEQILDEAHNDVAGL